MSVDRPLTGEQRFNGGMYYRGGAHAAHANRPMAELVVDQSLIRIRLRHKWMRRLFLGRFPVVELALEGARAKPSGSTMLTRAIELSGYDRGEYRSVLFSCNKSTQQRVIDLLRTRGVTAG
jgi:hypothetical protein